MLVPSFCSHVTRFEAASTDVDELDKKKMGQDNAIDSLMEEVSMEFFVLFVYFVFLCFVLFLFVAFHDCCVDGASVAFSHPPQSPIPYSIYF